MATGMRKAGPIIPTFVGIKQVRKAASQPNPSLRAMIYTERTAIMKMMLGKYLTMAVHEIPLIWWNIPQNRW